MRWPFVSLAVLLAVVLLLAVPSLAHEEIEVDPDKDEFDKVLFQGDDVKFKIWVKNSNDTDINEKTFDIGIEEVNGTGLTLDTDEASLEIAQSYSKPFNVTASASGSTELGNHEIMVKVSDQSNESKNTTIWLTVDVQEAPEYEIDISMTAEPQEIAVGGNVEITVTVENKAEIDDRVQMTWSGGTDDIVDVAFSPPNPDLPAGDEVDVTVTIYGQAEGQVSLKFTATSINDGEISEETSALSVTVTKKSTPEEETEGFLEAEVAGIPLIALFMVIIVVPIVAVVVLQKKKKGKAGAKGAPAAPGMAGAAPGMPGAQPGVGGAQPMVMHCPNCGGVIEIPNPGPPQPVQCMHCGSRYNFPGTGQAAPPPQQQAYGAPAAAPQQAAMQQTPCPACGTSIPIPPQRPVTVACPGCGASYNIN